MHMGMMRKCDRSGARQGVELAMKERTVTVAERAVTELDAGEAPDSTS
jgi:hypothetical protein